MREEPLWICVMVKNGRFYTRLTDTIAVTRKDSYKYLSIASGHTLKQLRRYGWKAVKIKLTYEL